MSVLFPGLVYQFCEVVHTCIRIPRHAFRTNVKQLRFVSLEMEKKEKPVAHMWNLQTAWLYTQKLGLYFKTYMDETILLGCVWVIVGILSGIQEV